MEHKEQGEKKKKKKRWPLLLLLLLLIGLAVGGYLIWQRFWHQPNIVAGDVLPELGDADNGHLPNMTPEEVKEQMQKAADASYFGFKINARPVFENGSSEGDLNIENPNYNVYPMVVEIYLDDTGELIYSSGGILPNHYIEKARLTKALEAGTYKATAQLRAYDPDTKEYLGQSGAKLDIVIKN